MLDLSRCAVVSWQVSCNGFVMILNESRKLLDAMLSLPNKCACPVSASS